MCLHLPPAPDGSNFIDGVHYVMAGPKRGHIRVLFKNTNANEAYADRIQSSLASHMYMYLRKVMHYSERCCQKLLNSWFTIEEALMAL